MENFKNEAKRGDLEGKRFPETIIGSSLKLDHILGKGWSIVTINAKEQDFMSKTEIEWWKDIGAIVIGLSTSIVESFSDVIDISKKHLFIIRPDKTISKHLIK